MRTTTGLAAVWSISATGKYTAVAIALLSARQSDSHQSLVHEYLVPPWLRSGRRDGRNGRFLRDLSLQYCIHVKRRD